jgi:NADP-dependent 3-hydroxy acid dehydrogenase YdfG
MLSSGITRTIGPDIYDIVPCLHPKDVSDAVIYVLGTPPHVQVRQAFLCTLIMLQNIIMDNCE